LGTGETGKEEPLGCQQTRKRETGHPEKRTENRKAKPDAEGAEKKGWQSGKKRVT